MAVATRPTTRSGRGYPDLREHLEALDRAGLLVRVRRPMLAETEIHPLVRWQYRGGLPEEQWRAVLFRKRRTGQGGASPFRGRGGGLPAAKDVYAPGPGGGPGESAERGGGPPAARVAPAA